MKLIFVVLFSGLAFATGENPGCDDMTVATDKFMLDLAHEFTNKCPDVNFIAPSTRTVSTNANKTLGLDQTQPVTLLNLGRMEPNSPKKICDCLRENKFTDIRVPEDQKRAFNETHINESIGKNINFAMKDLFGNVTRFKNLNLPGDVHEKAKKMCNPGKMIKSIDQMKAKVNSPGCNVTSEQFEARIKNIFGDTKPEDYVNNYIAYNLGVDNKSCISRQKFLHLRSSTHIEQLAGLRTSQASTLEDFFLNENLGPNSPELLKFDFFFSQGMRDPEYKVAMAAYIKENYPERPVRMDLSKALPNDAGALDLAYKSLERGCTNLSVQIETFLCSEKVPVLHSRNLSLAVNDRLSNTVGDQITDQSVREFFVKRYACMEGEFATEETKPINPFNKFYEATANLKRGLVDPVSPNPDSDYSKFNQTFCKGKAGTRLNNNDLATLMKDFIAEKMAANIDIRSVLANPQYAGMLNFNLDPNANPPITPRIRQNGAPVLPEISRSAWEWVARDLISKGMTRGETDQLYSIIEMQTNLRLAEVRSVRERLQSSAAKYAFITDYEVDGLLRNDPTVVANFRRNNPTISDPVTAATSIYQQQEQSRTERFDPNGIVDKVLRNNAAQTNNAIGNGAVAAAIADLPNTDRKDNIQDNPAANSETQRKESPAPVTANKPNFSPSYNGGSSSSSGSTSTSSSTSSASSASTTADASSNSFDSDSSYDSGSYSRNGSSTTSAKSKVISDDIKRLQDEMAQSQARFEKASQYLANSQKNRNAAFPNPAGRTQRADAGKSNYQYPKNLPVKTQNGDYYTPDTQGSELSSASGSSPSKSPSSGSGSSSSGGSAASASVGGGASFGSSGISGSSKASGRNPSSVSTDSVMKNLAVFEYNRYVPHSIFDVVGSIDKVILLLGLEGKSFKTIEAIEEPEEATGKIKIKYYERTFDFVPEGKFQKFKDLFSTKESRTDAFKEYFSFPRNKENVTLSKQYSLATKVISKEEVPHSHVLNIQNYILSDEEIRDTMNRTMELIK